MENIYFYPKELDQPIFQSGLLTASGIRQSCITKNFLVEDLNSLNDLEIESNLIIFFPMPMDSTNLSNNMNSTAWFNLLENCLDKLKRIPNSLLVTGCDWDEYNITLKNDIDLIKIILDKFRKEKISLSRLIWLYSNPFVPQWINERIHQSENYPYTIYFSAYLNRCRSVKQFYDLDINLKSNKSHWFLSCNRIARAHRINLALHFYNNRYRPSHIGCRVGSPMSDDLEDFFFKKEGYECLKKNFNIKSSLREYLIFSKTLPWNLDFDNNKNIPLSHQDKIPANFIYNSACNIITETYFETPHNDNAIYQGYISEKTYKNFLWGMPGLWLGSFKTIESFKKLGFKSYSEMIDESYDQEANYSKRMDIVLAEIEKIQKIENITEWYRKGQEIYIHNYKVLMDLIERNIPKIIDEYCLSLFRTK